MDQLQLYNTSLKITETQFAELRDHYPLNLLRTWQARELSLAMTLLGHRLDQFSEQNLFEIKHSRAIAIAHDFSSGLRERYVEGYVTDTPVEAFLDSGADVSFISPRLVNKLGLAPHPG